MNRRVRIHPWPLCVNRNEYGEPQNENVTEQFDPIVECCAFHQQIYRELLWSDIQVSWGSAVVSPHRTLYYIYLDFDPNSLSQQRLVSDIVLKHPQNWTPSAEWDLKEAYAAQQ